MRRMNSRLRWSALGWGTACLFAAVEAVAEDARQFVVEVEGQTYLARVEGDAAVALPVPLRTRLVRDAQQAPPPCARIEQALASYRVWIEDCKRAGPAAPAACQSIRNIVQRLRSDPGPLGAMYLTQGWAIESDPATDAPLDTIVRAEVATAAGLPSAAVHIAREAAGIGVPNNVALHVRPGGSSLASLLVGFADLSPDALRYRSDVRRFVSEDHVLACGLLQGDVLPSWEQDAELRAPPLRPLLSAEQLYEIYEALRSVDALREPSTSASARALQVGVHLGAALAALQLADGDLEAKASLAVDILFEGADLRLREQLGRDEIASLLDQRPSPQFQISRVSWQAREAR